MYCKKSMQSIIEKKSNDIQFIASCLMHMSVKRFIVNGRQQATMSLNPDIQRGPCSIVIADLLRGSIKIPQ